jgi:arsenate reductase
LSDLAGQAGHGALIPDPAAADGSAADVAQAFENTYDRLSRRIGRFLALPLSTLDRHALKAKLMEIGRIEER